MQEKDIAPPRLNLQGMFRIQAHIQWQCMRAFTEEDSDRELLLLFACYSFVHLEAEIGLKLKIRLCTRLSMVTNHVVKLRNSWHNNLQFGEKHQINESLTGIAHQHMLRGERNSDKHM